MPLTRSGGLRALTMVTAAHEVAHAVARLVLDEALPHPGPMLKQVSVRADAGRLGHVAMDERAPIALRDHSNGVCPEVLARNLRFDIVELLAGPVATIRYRHGTDAMHRDAAYLHQPCLCVLTPCDHIRARAKAAWLAPAHEMDVLRAGWAVACALVHREWPAILDVARILRVAGLMSGTAFEACWAVERGASADRHRRDRMLIQRSFEDLLAAYLAGALDGTSSSDFGAV